MKRREKKQKTPTAPPLTVSAFPASILLGPVSTLPHTLWKRADISRIFLDRDLVRTSALAPKVVALQCVSEKEAFPSGGACAELGGREWSSLQLQKAACGLRLQQVIICNGQPNWFLNFMVITLRLWKGNDGTVRCQIPVYCHTSGVTVALRIQCKVIFCIFGFISSDTPPAVKM